MWTTEALLRCIDAGFPGHPAHLADRVNILETQKARSHIERDGHSFLRHTKHASCGHGLGILPPDASRVGQNGFGIQTPPECLGETPSWSFFGMKDHKAPETPNPARTYSRNPADESASSLPREKPGLYSDFLRLACLTQGVQDHPCRWRRARKMLMECPEIARSNIYTASAVGDVTAVRHFLKENPDLGGIQGGPHNWEPILYLAFSRINSDAPGHSATATAALLLENGADPNAGYLWCGFPSPYTALTGAFGEGENGPERNPPHQYCYRLAELLINAGADPNDSQTLYNRMFSRNDDHLEFLFSHGLGKDQDRIWYRRLGEQNGTWVGSAGKMLAYQMQWAVRWNYAERVKVLVENGADVNRPSHFEDARSPFSEAVYHGNSEIAAYLLEHGAIGEPLDYLDRFAGACIMADRVAACSLLDDHPQLLKDLGDRAAVLMENAIASDNRDAVRLMVGLGFDVDSYGIQEAARYGHLGMIKLLVDLGADVSQINRPDRSSALGIASHFRQKAVVDYLAQFAEVHRAVKSDLIDRVRYLLTQKPSCVNDRDDLGNSPMHYLDIDNQMIHSRDILDLLIVHGADVNAENNEGITPLGRLEQLPRFTRRDDLAEILRRQGAEH